MGLIKLMADPFPPYQYYSRSGDVTGIDYQIIKESFQLQGYEIAVELKEWVDLAPYFESKQVQGLFQVQPTEERKKIYLFSDVIRDSKTCFFSRIPDRNINSVEELVKDGVFPLGVLSVYSYGDMVDNLDPVSKKGYNESLELLKVVNRGDVEHCVFDYGVALYLIKEHGLKNVHTVNGITFIRPLAVAFQKESEDLCRSFNSGLMELKERGRYNEIINGDYAR